MVVCFLRALVTKYTGTTAVKAPRTAAQWDYEGWMHEAIRLLLGFVMPVASREGSN